MCVLNSPAANSACSGLYFFFLSSSLEYFEVKSRFTKTCVCIIFQPSLCLLYLQIILIPLVLHSSLPVYHSQEQVEMVTGGEQSKFVTPVLKKLHL